MKRALLFVLVLFGVTQSQEVKEADQTIKNQVTQEHQLQAGLLFDKFKVQVLSRKKFIGEDTCGFPNIKEIGLKEQLWKTLQPRHRQYKRQEFKNAITNESLPFLQKLKTICDFDVDPQNPLKSLLDQLISGVNSTDFMSKIVKSQSFMKYVKEQQKLAQGQTPEEKQRMKKQGLKLLENIKPKLGEFL